MLFETVLRKSSKWGNPDNMMYVVGATRASMLEKVRKIVPDHFLLIPGVGAQGGRPSRSGRIWPEQPVRSDRQFFAGHYLCRFHRTVCRRGTGKSPGDEVTEGNEEADGSVI